MDVSQLISHFITERATVQARADPPPNPPQITCEGGCNNPNAYSDDTVIEGLGLTLAQVLENIRAAGTKLRRVSIPALGPPFSPPLSPSLNRILV